MISPEQCFAVIYYIRHSVTPQQTSGMPPKTFEMTRSTKNFKKSLDKITLKQSTTLHSSIHHLNALLVSLSR